MDPGSRGQVSGANGPQSDWEGDLDLHNIPSTLKQMLLDRIEEERRMRSLDKLLNVLLFGSGATVYINHFATLHSTSRLYPSRMMLVAGLNEVFHTVRNGTFTSGAFLMVFGAPSFALWALQSVIDMCLFVPHLIFLATICGKWVLGHFGAKETRDTAMRRRPLCNWPRYVRARVLSSLDALPVIFALSQGLYPMCWLTAQYPLVGICFVVVLSIFYLFMRSCYQELMASHL